MNNKVINEGSVVTKSAREISAELESVNFTKLALLAKTYKDVLNSDHVDILLKRTPVFAMLNVLKSIDSSPYVLNEAQGLKAIDRVPVKEVADVAEMLSPLTPAQAASALKQTDLLGLAKVVNCIPAFNEELSLHLFNRLMWNFSHVRTAELSMMKSALSQMIPNVPLEERKLFISEFVYDLQTNRKTNVDSLVDLLVSFMPTRKSIVERDQEAIESYLKKNEAARDNHQMIESLDSQSLVRFVKFATNVSKKDIAEVMCKIEPNHILDLFRILGKRKISIPLDVAKAALSTCPESHVLAVLKKIESPSNDLIDLALSRAVSIDRKAIEKLRK